MAVQAQYPSDAFTLPDFRKAPAAAAGLPGGGHLLLEEHRHQIGHLLGAYYASPFSQPQAGSRLPSVLNGTAVFSEQESELTCNASGSRKRGRDEPVEPAFLPQQQQQQLRVAAGLPPKTLLLEPASAISTGLQLSFYDGSRRLNESAMTSTSGRPPASSGVAPSPAVSSPLAQDLVSQLYQQNLEVDALIRLQNEKLRSGMEEANKRHCRVLLSAVEQQVLRRLREKETELETAHRRNAELEEKVRQMSAENHIWFNVARNNEAVVASLRTTLEQVLLQNAAGAVAAPAAPPATGEEGYGDSEGGAGAGAMYPADDAQSCCFDESERERKVAAAEATEGENRELRRRRACRVCGEGEVSVLLLPCRHLCLCKACETRLDACPICSSVKNASLQVFMS